MPGSHRLAVHTSGDRDIIITRNFDAKRTQVFAALTVPEHLKRWLLGPTGWEMYRCDIDLKKGGHYRFCWRRNSDGNELSMGGSYVEIDPPYTLIATEKFEKLWYPGEALITQTLSKRDNKSSLHMTMSYESREARDLVLKSEMATGLEQSYQKLDDLLLAFE